MTIVIKAQNQKLYVVTLLGAGQIKVLGKTTEDRAKKHGLVVRNQNLVKINGTWVMY